MSESQIFGGFLCGVGGCSSLRPGKERGPTALKWWQAVGERAGKAGSRVSRSPGCAAWWGALCCFTFALVRDGTREFNQSCHLEVSVCILADVDGNREWGRWLRQVGPGFWKIIVAGEVQ